MEKELYLAALCAVPDIGPVTVKSLLRAFGSPEAVFRASQKDLFRVENVGEKRAREISEFNGFDKLAADIEKVKAGGARLLTLDDEGYPPALKALGDLAPQIVYIKGEVQPVDSLALAIVGSRTPTPYGISVTETIASGLAAMGMTVVSGGAAGIDTAAHASSTGAGGRTIAVLGSGIDVPYPARNKGLFSYIAQRGAVISEFPPGMPPHRENFPRRNRLISGLSLGVLVVEAAAKSGALITAHLALEQGKEVFAVPGNISSKVSAGTNDLIRQGARVVMGIEDIIDELAPSLKGLRPTPEERPRPSLTDEERALCDIMSLEPIHIDLISRQGGVPVNKALGILLGLELKGVVRQHDGKKFRMV